MIDCIKNWWRAYKKRGRLAEIERMRDTFRIKEKNGALWIMHHDTAVDMIPAFASSEEIVRMLEETRCCAVEYAFGVYSEDKGSELEQVDARVIDNPFYVKSDIEGTPI